MTSAPGEDALDGLKVDQTGQPLRLGARRHLDPLAGGQAPRDDPGAGAPAQLRLGRRGREDALPDRADGPVPDSLERRGHPPVTLGSDLRGMKRAHQACQALRSAAPVFAKSPTLRVTTVYPWCRAVAAIKPSTTASLPPASSIRAAVRPRWPQWLSRSTTSDRCRSSAGWQASCSRRLSSGRSGGPRSPSRSRRW